MSGPPAGDRGGGKVFLIPSPTSSNPSPPLTILPSLDHAILIPVLQAYVRLQRGSRAKSMLPGDVFQCLMTKFSDFFAVVCHIQRREHVTVIPKMTNPADFNGLRIEYFLYPFGKPYLRKLYHRVSVGGCQASLTSTYGSQGVWDPEYAGGAIPGDSGQPGIL